MYYTELNEQLDVSHRNLPIRAMHRADLGEVVIVHIHSFDGFFLSFLGSFFLYEFYDAILSDLSGMAYVYEDSDHIAGFVVGTDQPSGFYRRLIRRRWWRFGIASIKPILKRPTIIPRLLRAFSVPETLTQEKDRGTLMSIAVLPDEQGKGIGRALMVAFLEEAIHRNLKRVDLTTDKLDNEQVNNFYQNFGFICSRSFVTPEGREMNEYVIDLRGEFQPKDQ